MANDPDEAPSLLERKLVTILSADVAEYSRLMAEDEEATLRTFRQYSEIFSALVDSHHGRIFNTAGDAILAEFTSPVEAVRCATDIQAALRSRNDLLSPNRQVRFRIGVNLGDVMMQNSDLMGDGVNVAARLQGAAEPGGICLSGSVYDQIRNKLSLSFESLGERRYKNIPQPVRTFSIAGTDSHVPDAKPAPAKPKSWLMAGVAAAALLLLAGGYWATHFKSPVDQTGVTAPPARPVAAPAAKPATPPAPVNQEAQPPAGAPQIQSSAALPDSAAAQRPQRKVRTLTDGDTASEVDADNNIPAGIFDQITEEKAAEAACLDATKADPAAAAASDSCSRRDRLVEDLRAKGWCGKPRGDTGVRIIWNECR